MTKSDDQFPAASETRENFRYFTSITTRWRDNDVYQHVNNTVYISWMDTAVAEYLIKEGGMRYGESKTIGLIVESFCQYRAPVAYPEVVEAGIRVAHIGGSSARYEVGIFKEGVAEAASVGYFVHVFVDSDTNRPAGVPPAYREALERIKV